MEFINPFFVGALAVMALPILIHLLTRDRIIKVAFSTLRFFAKSSTRILRRKKFQEMLLLALRVIIMAAVALAFARPFLRSPDNKVSQTSEARRARVILADLSGSVGQSGSTEALRKAALAALGEMDREADAVALVSFADAPRIEVPMANDLGAIRSKIGTLIPGQGGTDFPEALRLANSLLDQVKAVRKDIILISDLQRNGWVGSASKAAGLKISPGVNLSVRTLPAPPPALTITELDCPESLVMDNTPRNVAVRLLNQTNQEIKEQPVTLMIDGKTAATKKVNLQANTSGAVRFARVFDRPGDNPGLICLGTGTTAAATGNAAMDKMFFNVRVIPRIKVVILNGTPSANPVLDGGFFLMKALAPDTNFAFDVRSVPVAQATPADLAGVQVAIAANVSKVPGPVQAALAELLKRGGGLLLLPGETVEAKDFNATFANMAPCQLRKTLSVENPEESETAGAAIAKLDFDHPVFSIFLRPHHGDFSNARFFRWWEISDSQTATVLARYDDNRPALLEKPVGRGIAMLLTSSPDLRWSNLPLRAVFLPYLHETVRYLAIRTERRTAFQVGQVVEIPEGRQLLGPDGKAISGGEGGKVALGEAGIYTWNGADGKPDYLIAVNAARQEATSATVSADEIIAAVQPDTSETQAAADISGDETYKALLDLHSIWWYLAAAAALMFMMELLVANRTLRH